MKPSKNHDFKIKQVEHYGNLGEKLKRLREKKGYTIDQVSLAGKIKKSWLEQLESGNFDELPPDVFVQGFLKKYAEFLGINPNIISNWFKRERAIAKNIEKIKEPQMPKPVHSPKMVITPKRIIISLLILAMLGISGFIYNQFSAFRNPPKLEVASPSENQTTKENTITVEGKTDAGADIFISDQSIPVGDDGSFKINFSLVSGSNIIKISAKNKVGKERIIERNVIAQLPQIEAPQEQIVETKIDLTLEVINKSTFIDLDIDGQTSNQIAAPKTTQHFTAKKSIIITTGNAANIKITVNGKLYDKLGKDGEAKKIIIDETGVKY